MIRYKVYKNVLFFFLGSLFFACVDLKSDKPIVEFNSSDLIEDELKDSMKSKVDVIIEEERVKSDTIIEHSLFQLEYDNLLKDKSIENYYKDVYFQEKLVIAEDSKMLSITDSLFNTNDELGLFYFTVFTKSMNGSDGFYSEALGLSSLEFIKTKTEYFAEYFNKDFKLTEKDMDNWAYYIYGEIQMSREGEELKAIKELQFKIMKNISESRKEYLPIIEKLIKKIKKVHADAVD